MPLIFYPFPFGPSTFTSGSPGWTDGGGVGTKSWSDSGVAVAKSWPSTSTSTLRSWANLVLNTYDRTYDIGANFMIVANEEFPLYAVEDRPLVVPPDSGYSQP